LKFGAANLVGIGHWHRVIIIRRNFLQSEITFFLNLNELEKETMYFLIRFLKYIFYHSCQSKFD
jgi:hypothetical protein